MPAQPIHGFARHVSDLCPSGVDVCENETRLAAAAKHLGVSEPERDSSERCHEGVEIRGDGGRQPVIDLAEEHVCDVRRPPGYGPQNTPARVRDRRAERVRHILVGGREKGTDEGAHALVTKILRA